MNRTLFLLIVAFLLPHMGHSAGHEAGERLYYIVKWGWLKAGEAELLWQPATDDTPQTITARVWTSVPFFSLRERLSSQSGADFQSIFYEQHQQENDYRAYKTVKFDHENQQATYQNHLGRLPPQVFDIPPDSHDMMAALYKLRHSLGTLTNIPDMHVVALDKAYHMASTASEPYTMRTASDQKIKVVDIQPALRYWEDGKPVGEKWQNWVMTVTDDTRRLPVKITYASKFGTFKAILQDVGTLADASRAPADLPLTGDLPE